MPDKTTGQRIVEEWRPTMPDEPVGADTRNQTFPSNFEKYSDAQKQKWFEGTAKVTYMAQCSHAENIEKWFADLSRRIDQALETANAEVDRLRERLEVILAHPEGVAYSSDFWKAFAREALAKKETP